MMTKDFRWMNLCLLFAGLQVSLLFPHRANAQQFSAWSAPVNLNNIAGCQAVVNSGFNDTHPALSKDGLSLYFASTRPGGSGDYDLWVTQRDSLDDCWLAPRNLGPVVNSAAQDFAPNLSTDGHWLFFHSKRPTWLAADGVTQIPSCGGTDLYVSHRQDKRDDFGWENPINLGCTINTPGFDQAGPTYFEDDTTGTHFLYFTQKPTPPPGINNDNLFDIYVSVCSGDVATCNTQGLWGPAIPVDALNSPFRDTRTAIRRRDGLEMILSSGRPGSLMSENLWLSTRTTVTLDQGNWQPPVPINCEWQQNVTAILNSLLPPVTCPSWAPLDPPASPPAATIFVDSNAFDGGPALSWDGTELYFFRVRPDLLNIVGCQDPINSVPICRHLYVSKRTKLTGPQ
jgi:hypothetical protein